MDNLTTLISNSSSTSINSTTTNPPILHSTALDPESERVKNEFTQGLEKLTFNCKNTITSLTEYARLRTAFAPGVVAALEAKIMAAPADKKLPFLYLLDSIVKNIGAPYLSLFAPNLKPLFLTSYESLREEKLRNSFRRVLQTWRVVFPPYLIRAIEEAIFGEKIPQNYSQITPKAYSTLMNQTVKKGEEPVPQLARQPPKSAISPQLIASLQSLNIPLFSNAVLPMQQQQQRQAAPQIKNASSFAASPASNAAAAAGQTVNITLSAKAQRGSQKLPSAYLASSEFVGQKYQDAHWILYRSIRSSCASCGLRFADTPMGKQRLSLHLDWHYKRNRRIKDKCKRPISRDWFPTETVSCPLPLPLTNPLPLGMESTQCK